MKRCFALALFPVLAACSQERVGDVTAPKTLQVTSPDFSDLIPAKCANAPPKIVWSDPPAGTKELALIVDDPDAPMDEPYVHYVLTRIAPKGPPPEPVVGKGESGRCVWEPLDPPAGETHRYFFRVYALDLPLGGSPRSKTEVLAAIQGHVLAWGELVGRFGKK